MPCTKSFDCIDNIEFLCGKFTRSLVFCLITTYNSIYVKICIMLHDKKVYVASVN